MYFSDVLGGNGSSPAPHNQNMKFGGLPYEMHRLGGRNEVSHKTLIFCQNLTINLFRTASLMLW